MGQAYRLQKKMLEELRLLIKAGDNLNENKTNVTYMISPLDLTERQLLIYQKLYKKSDFSDMTVKYTYEQLANDIKLINISKKIANSEVKYLIERGYLEEVKRGNKGNPNTFRVIKISEIPGNESVTNRELIGNEKPSKNKALDGEEVTNRERMGNEKVTPIKDKRIKNNIYISNLAEEIWKLYPYKKGKTKSIDYINKILKSISKDELLRCIDRYKKDVENQRANGFKTLAYKNGSTFFNGGYVDYLDTNYEIDIPKENKKIDISSYITK